MHVSSRTAPGAFTVTRQMNKQALMDPDGGNKDVYTRGHARQQKKKMKLYSAWNSTRHLQVSAAYRGKSVSGVNSLIWMEAYGQTHGLDVTMQ